MKSLLSSTALALLLTAPLSASAQEQLFCAGGEPAIDGVCANGSKPLSGAAQERREAKRAEVQAERRAAKQAAKEAAAEQPAAEQPAAEQQAAPAEQPAAAEETAEKPARRRKERAAEAAQEEKPAAKAAEAAREAAPKEEEAEAAEAARKPTREERAAAREATRAERQAERQAEREAAREAARTERQAERQAEREAAREAARAERRAERQAERKKQAEAAAEDRPARTADTPAADAAAADAAVAAGEGTVVQEADVPAAIVADDVTDAQRQRIRELEQARRRDRRERRRELIGAGAAGVAVGATAALLGGRLVEDRGDRLIVRRDDGSYLVRRDENELLRTDGSRVVNQQLEDGRQRTVVVRPDGTRIITIRDDFGNILRRVRRSPNGVDTVLIDNQEISNREIDFARELGPVRVGIPEEEYIVSARQADPRRLEAAFAATPVERPERVYSLREVRESERLRDKVRRVDLDEITFDTGSATVSRSQVALLQGVADAMNDVIADDPGALFLVEGHTDAVGNEIDNLALSDRRAETIARILSEVYSVPPENLIVEGYGEQDLKIPTETAERANRRVTLRNITPLLRG